MKRLQVTYKQTIHHRTAPDGWGDSNYSHSSVEERTADLVIQDDYPGTIGAALGWFQGQLMHDPAFKVISREIVGDIYAVVEPARMRL